MPENMIDSPRTAPDLQDEEGRRSRRCAASTSPSTPVRSSASSGPTAPGRPPPCGCSPPCSSQPVAMPRVAGCDLRTDPVGVREASVMSPRRLRPTPKREPARRSSIHARMYGIDAEGRPGNGQALFDQLDLEGLWARQCKTLSGGQRRRLDIAMGLVHQPSSCSSTSPRQVSIRRSRANLWEHVGRLRSEMDTTVFITTHYMDEADVLCDRHPRHRRRRHRRPGHSRRAQAKVAGDSVILSFEQPRSTVVVAELVSRLDGATDPSIEGNEVRLPGARWGRRSRAAPGNGRARPRRHGVEVHRPTLDDVFLTMTGRSLRDEANGRHTDQAAA